MIHSVRLVLFDIDGTLVGDDPAALRAWNAVAPKISGLPSDQISTFDYRGHTDRAIVSMLADIGHRLETEAEATAWLRLKDEAMLEIIEHDPGAKCPKTLPGVPELLARLMDSRAVLGVASGITRVAANSKMDRAGLPKDAFSVWSLGDHVTRTDWLVQDAIDLVSASPGETLVVGNTPSYIEAAHACGARALAVATGPYSFSDLRRAGADYVAHSLDISDPAAIAVFGQ